MRERGKAGRTAGLRRLLCSTPPLRVTDGTYPSGRATFAAGLDFEGLSPLFARVVLFGEPCSWSGGQCHGTAAVAVLLGISPSTHKGGLEAAEGVAVSAFLSHSQRLWHHQ